MAWSTDVGLITINAVLKSCRDSARGQLISIALLTSASVHAAAFSLPWGVSGRCVVLCAAYLDSSSRTGSMAAFLHTQARSLQL